MSVINTQPLIGASGNQGGAYNIERSLRLRSSAGGYLSRTPSSGGNQQKWTISFWTKRASISGALQKLFEAGTNSSNYLNITWNGSGGGPGADQLDMYCSTAGAQTCYFDTAAVHRDCSAWYHVVVSVDTTQATASNRVKFYINGSQITAFTTANYPAQNANLFINGAHAHTIGNGISNGQYLDGYLANVQLIDGQQLTPSSFGETDTITGVWKPKAYSGTYGTNGFYLKFTDVATTSGSNAGLGKDFSGNGNYWNTNNISVTSGSTYDSMTDVPTLTSATAANYCTLNPLYVSLPNGTVTNGNLQVNSSVSSDNRIHGTMAVTSGKWYYETAITATSGIPYYYVGWAKAINTNSSTYNNLYYNSYEWGSDGVKQTVVNGSSSSSSAATFTTGDVLGIAFDADAGTITCYKNGTSLGVYFSGITVDVPMRPDVYFNSCSAYVNFGQRPFTYTPPTGYKALNTYNLPDSTIVAGNKVMDATLYTGNGYPTSGTQTITNAGAFKPDFIWIKSRSATGWNSLTDSVRGVNSQLFSNATNAQQSNTDQVTAINSDGFSLGSNTTGNGSTNVNGVTHVGWQWQAGQGSTSSNTSGTITSTTSVNSTAGFSIVTYTGNNTAGATIGHGLGVKPSMIIIKNRNIGTTNWLVYHTSIGATKFLKLESTDAVGTSNLAFNNTEPTSSVFSVGAWDVPNGNGNSHVAYCWSEVAGFSKFGSYTGNGSADGVFVYTGFRPKWIMIKNTTTAGTYWFINDSSRNTYNPTGLNLGANASDAEGNDAPVFDFLSNGFKLRCTYGSFNTNGNTMIYAAFAENPFKNSLAR